jgi:MOSC domain-containing protein YiiM
MAQIYSITYQPVDQSYEGERFSAFIRVPVEEARLIAGHGIEGDAKAGRNPRRQLNLLSYEWLEGLRQQGYQTEPGAFGEQMIIRGLDVLTLQPGERLRLGNGACIEITKPRTGCTRLEAAQGVPIPKEALKAGIGVLATVITSGVIRVGDSVEVVPQEERLAAI